MANPNRTVWHWRQSNPTHQKAVVVRCNHHGHAQAFADEQRATKKWSRVTVWRNEVNLYKLITEGSWRESLKVMWHDDFDESQF